MYPRTVSIDRDDNIDHDGVPFSYHNPAYIPDEYDPPPRYTGYPMTVGDIDPPPRPRPQKDRKKAKEMEFYTDENGYTYLRRRRKSSAAPKSTWWMWTRNRKSQLDLEKERELNGGRETNLPLHILKAIREMGNLMTTEVMETRFGILEENNEKSGSRDKGDKFVNKMSLEDWRHLLAYWDLQLFQLFRIFGVINGLIGFVLTMISLGTPHWIFYFLSGRKVDAGLWQRCENSTCSLILRGFSSNPLEDEFRLQTVIGFMMFTAAFSLLGSILGVYGLVLKKLPKKLFHLHSAGEIFLVCMIGGLVSVNVYVAALQGMDKMLQNNKIVYNYGYYVCWAADVCFLVSAVLLLFDEVFRECFRSRTIPKRAVRMYNKIF